MTSVVTCCCVTARLLWLSRATLAWWLAAYVMPDMIPAELGPWNMFPGMHTAQCWRPLFRIAGRWGLSGWRTPWGSSLQRTAAWCAGWTSIPSTAQRACHTTPTSRAQTPTQTGSCSSFTVVLMGRHCHFLHVMVHTELARSAHDT